MLPITAVKTKLGNNEKTTNKKGARGARFYRSSFAKAVELFDIFLVILIVSISLRIYTHDRLLSASLAISMPMGVATLVFWWILRENDLYHYSSCPRPFIHFVKLVGSTIIALPVVTFTGIMLSTITGRPMSECVAESVFITILIGGILSIVHFIAAKIVKILSNRGAFSTNVVIVGATKCAADLIKDQADQNDICFLGIFDDRLDRAPSKIGDVPVIGDLTNLMEWPLLPSVDRVIITVSSAAQARILQLVEKLRGMPNKIVLAIDMQGFESDGTTFGRLGKLPVAYVSGTPEDAKRAFWKRLQDIIIASIALVLLSPLLLIVAIAIKLESKGPILFRQTRHGFNNQPFKCWKFRSMFTEKTDHKATQQVVKDDPRVTKVGKFIRKTSIDELPQLINVISGAMSLVGPRPHAIGMKTGEVESEKIVRDYAHRHRIKPGITGWAAIHGSRGPVHTPEEVEERVRLDTEYIDKANFWMDLYIIFMTIPSLLGDKTNIR